MKAWTVLFISAPIVIMGLIVWLFGLGGYDQMRYGPRYIESRQALWQGVIARELPVGSSLADIRRWARDRSFAVSQLADGKNIEILVETIPWHQVVCTEWKIIAEVDLKDDVSIGDRVVSMGACL